jgi:hypothetical protein
MLHPYCGSIVPAAALLDCISVRLILPYFLFYMLSPLLPPLGKASN